MHWVRGGEGGFQIWEGGIRDLDGPGRQQAGCLHLYSGGPVYLLRCLPVPH